MSGAVAGRRAGRLEQIRRSWRSIRPFLGASRAGLGVLVALSALLGFAEAAALVLMMRAAVAIAAGDRSAELGAGPVGPFDLTLPALFVMAAVLMVVVVAGRAWACQLIAATSSRTLAGARTRLFDAFVAADWELQSSERAGRLQEIMTTNVDRTSGASLTLASGVAAGFQFLALLLSALLLQPLSALFITASVVGLYLLFQPVSRASRRLSRSLVGANVDYAGRVSEVVTMTQEVRTFGVGPAMVRDVAALVGRVARLHRRQKFLAKLVPALYQNAVLVVVLGGLVAIYALEVENIAELGAVVLILVRALTYTQIVQSSIQVMNEMTPYLHDVQREEDRLRSSVMTGGSRPLPRVDRVEMRGVSFAYGSGPDAVTDLTFEVERGEAVGIIGPSGSGKSTIMQLLLQLRRPGSGHYLVNGHDAAEYDLADWFGRVALVPQEARLFSGTVAENIRFFRPHVDDAALEQAARQAHLEHDLARFPHGWDTQVGERGGGSLSGGQRQRICIARALTTQPDILILDEPTSALDVHSESVIQESLEELRGSVTLFVIAHRMSTVAACDRIMVIDGGRLVDFAPPQDLARTSGYYREVSRLSGR